jgi:hypothetical protein
VACSAVCACRLSLSLTELVEVRSPRKGIFPFEERKTMDYRQGTSSETSRKFFRAPDTHPIIQAAHVDASAPQESGRLFAYEQQLISSP